MVDLDLGSAANTDEVDVYAVRKRGVVFEPGTEFGLGEIDLRVIHIEDSMGVTHADENRAGELVVESVGVHGDARQVEDRSAHVDGDLVDLVVVIEGVIKCEGAGPGLDAQGIRDICGGGGK